MGGTPPASNATPSRGTGRLNRLGLARLRAAPASDALEVVQELPVIETAVGAVHLPESSQDDWNSTLVTTQVPSNARTGVDA